MKQESDKKPINNYVIENIKDNRCDVVLFDLSSITNDKFSFLFFMYKYNSYRINLNHNQALIDRLNNDFEAFLEETKNYIIEQDKALKRAERNKLLDETDKEMAFDRLGIQFPDFDVPEDITLTNIISVFKNLIPNIKQFSEKFKKVHSSEMAIYRQKLRDITEDPNFPYVDFPEKPKDVK